MKKRIGKISVRCDYCGNTFLRYAGNVKPTTKLHFYKTDGNSGIIERS